MRHVGVGQQLAHGCEMRAAVVAEKILALRRGLGQLHVDFAVEQAQRIALESIAAILTQLGEMRAAVFQHRLAKPRTALRVAQRIDLEIQLQPELAAQLVDHHHQLGVGGGVGAAENLDPKLRELAKAALLRTLAPEHRADVVETLLRIAAVHPGLDIRAHHAGRAFGAQRQRGFGLVAVDEGVHLLFHHVRGLAA